MLPRTGTRIAFVVSSLHGGGAEAVGIAWMNWFAEAGYDVSAVMVSDKPESDLVDPRITVHRDAATGNHAAKVRAVRRLVRTHRYDALVALQTYPNLLAIAAAGRRARATARTGPRSSRPAVVVTEHNLISLGLPGSSMSHRAKIWLAKRWYRRADVVTSASHPVGAEMAAAFGVPSSRSLVVPNPAMAKVGHRTPVRRTPGTDRGIQLVLACRLVPQKSPHLALATAQALERRGIPTEVVSFGGGPLQGDLEKLADELGVRFTPHGWVEDWFDHFDDNSVVILPSHREGLGNVLIEAAARGVPAVAVSTALGVADAVIPGVTGELALDDDPESIADAVERAAHLRIEGIDAWLDRFTAEVSGSLLEEAVRYAHART
ncbi:glycosyltransferase [Microbacterium sp. 4R-513]|uniref:glycosyltransferase n=1 Tax=Microbacterium sp. 4R-513 TaxID=2567934 RepID=UPI0013E1B4D0|nr:glycosyltransferase [Microbacterium sp. 4R-513]QIG38544.1 glycosyltransferase [Microbacterium sp. 4R-513]